MRVISFYDIEVIISVHNCHQQLLKICYYTNE